MNALELMAQRQSVWSATAGRLKAEFDTTRWVTFGLSILGALAATIAIYGLNGLRFTFTNDEAYDLVISVATGELDDVKTIAAQLERGTEPRG